MTVPFDPDDVDVIVVQAPAQSPVLTVKVPGPQGPPGVFSVGTVETGEPGTDAEITAVDDGTGHGGKVVNFVIPRGDPGHDAAFTISSVSGSGPTTDPQVILGGTAPNYTLDFVIPQGPKGDKGDQGIQGPLGPVGPIGPKGDPGAGIQIGGQVNTYAQLPSGLTMADAGKAWFVVADGKLYIWSGTAFPANGAGTIFQGPVGPANTLTMGTVTTGDAGTSATAAVTGTAPNQTLSLTIPRGADGPAGPANVLSIGTVTTGAAGSNASASITGTSPSQTLNLTIPQGAQGPQGIQGPVGPQGVSGGGVLVLGATDPVPPGTPAGTVIYRPAIKTPTYYWGSGTSFPTLGLGSGDTYFHTGLGCLMGWDGVNWRQREATEVASLTARDTISTTYSSLLYAGFKVLVAGTEYIWNGSKWLPDQWIYVGAAGAPAFQNGWINYDNGVTAGTYQTARFMKTSNNIVIVQGLVKNGTTGGILPIFTLPAGYRPKFVHIFSVMTSATTPSRMDVYDTGNITPNAGGNGWWSLECSFPAEQ
jgi:hypothetical protein